jgi:CheY-like chemotaxis protein
VKVLIADDDRTTRVVLATVLREQFSLTPVETTDGVQTLQTIQNDSPDAVLLDLGMPNMTGLEVLKALRAAPAYAELPVVVISGSRDQADVKEAIGLGVLDYLIKPLQIQTLRDRLNRSLGRIVRESREKAAPDSPRDPGPAPDGLLRVLLVDRDIDFRQFFGGLFDHKVHVETRALAAEAVAAFADSRPAVVFLGERRSGPDERALARKLREMDPLRRSLIYLCSTTDRLSAEDSTIFDGLLRRSFMSEAIRRDVMQIVSRTGPVAPRALAQDLSEEIVRAFRETVGAMTGQEISLLDATVSGVMREVAVRVQLVADGGVRSAIELEFAASVRDVERYAGMVRGATTALDRGGADAFRKLASTIAGRVIPFLAERGITMRLHFATVITQVGDRRPWDVRLAFETAGCRVHVGVVLEEKERAPHVSRANPTVR